MICASFHGLGKYGILKIALNNIMIKRIAFGRRVFRILLSISGALLFFVFSIMILITYAVLLGTV